MIIVYKYVPVENKEAKTVIGINSMSKLNSKQLLMDKKEKVKFGDLTKIHIRDNDDD